MTFRSRSYQSFPHSVSLLGWPILRRFIFCTDSSNEKVHLEKRLQSLSSELVSLRNHIHVTQEKDNSCNKREKVLKHLNSFVQNKLTSSEGFSLEWKPDQRPKLQQSKEKGLRVRSSSRLCKQLTSESNLQVTEEKLQGKRRMNANHGYENFLIKFNSSNFRWIIKLHSIFIYQRNEPLSYS